jgi:hypothetical protein
MPKMIAGRFHKPRDGVHQTPTGSTKRRDGAWRLQRRENIALRTLADWRACAGTLIKMDEAVKSKLDRLFKP